jgi:hypothetical protein
MRAMPAPSSSPAYGAIPWTPSADPDFSRSIGDHGISCKTIFDCTVPFAMKDRFKRSKFMEVDVSRFIPGFK